VRALTLSHKHTGNDQNITTIANADKAQLQVNLSDRSATAAQENITYRDMSRARDPVLMTPDKP
jgi:hypothetical protein